ncbi:MAG TPA: hypothetical protein VGB42_03175 [Candidatus Thermoplasmatota archaeon]
MDDEALEVLEVPEGAPTLEVPPGETFPGDRPGWAKDHTIEEFGNDVEALRGLWLLAAFFSIPPLAYSTWVVATTGGYGIDTAFFHILAMLGCLLLGMFSLPTAWRVRRRPRQFPMDPRIASTPPRGRLVLGILALAGLNLMTPIVLGTAFQIDPNPLEIAIDNRMDNMTDVHLLLWDKNNATLLDRSYLLPAQSGTTTGAIRVPRGPVFMEVTVDGNRTFHDSFWGTSIYGPRLIVSNTSIDFSYLVT